MTIRRVDHGNSHRYENVETGARIPGVTTMLNGVPKPGLINWAGEATADYAIDHWEELSALPLSERRRRLVKSRDEAKDKARMRGTKIHKLAERLSAGQRVRVPEGLEGYVEQCCRFLDEFNVQPVLTEFVVVSHEYDYCGTGDLIADLLDDEDPDGDMIRWLIDYKFTRSGIFGETALQLAGYRYADAYVDQETLEEHPIPAVERCGGVWITPTFYQLIPLEVSPAELRTLLYAGQMYEFEKNSWGLRGDPIAPPRPSTFRLTREDQDPA